MNPKEARLREREQRRERIVEAALEVFAHHGIKDTTVDEIAARAELAKGTVYYYFPSKEAILEGAIQASVDAHFEGLLARSGTLRTPYDIAETILSAYAQNFRASPESFKLVAMVFAEPEGHHQSVLRHFMRIHMEWLEELREATLPVLQRDGVEPNAFFNFLGTHAFGLMMFAASGRPVESLLDDTLNTLKTLFKTEESPC